MQLIKITPDKVQIKSNTNQLGRTSINDAMLVGDDETTLVCTVMAITRNEQEEQFDCETGELLEAEVTSTIECSIIGSLVNGKFSKAVDLYPSTDVRIEPVKEELFREMISGEIPSGFQLGKYASYDCEAVLDGNKLFQRHSAILGNTGSGKSVTVAAILEKLAKLKSANVILFDVHGEYQNLSYVKPVKIGDGGMDFPIWFLPLRDIYGNLLRIKEETATSQVAALRKAFYDVRKSDLAEDIPIAFQLDHLGAALREMNDEVVETGETYQSGAKAGMMKTVKGELNGKLSGLLSLLEDKRTDKRYQFMVRDHDQGYLSHFVESVMGIGEKNVKAVNLSDVPSDMIPTIIAVTAKLIYRIQLQQNRKELAPLTMICDEAHVYIPNDSFNMGASQRRLLDVFEMIAKEGRKFGVSLMVASQRPSELNRTILAQCANHIVLKMSNDADKQMIKGILPEGSRGLVDSVNLFAPGDCLVIGDAAPITFKMKVELPNEMPQSSTIDTWSEWEKEHEIDTTTLVSRLIGKKQKERIQECPGVECVSKNALIDELHADDDEDDFEFGPQIDIF